jgi:hypothetical protein
MTGPGLELARALAAWEARHEPQRAPAEQRAPEHYPGAWGCWWRWALAERCPPPPPPARVRR